MERNIDGTRLVLKQGDITGEETDAIVNAANSSLMGGGGVDGAIHRAGGPAILEECRKIKGERGPLPPGQAVVTTGGDLKARRVIHTVGPIWSGGEKDEEDTLRNCYWNSLSLAVKEGLRTVAFPSISTGAYGYPVELASKTALEAVRDFLKEEAASDLEAIVFVLFSESDLQVYASALEKLEAS